MKNYTYYLFLVLLFSGCLNERKVKRGVIKEKFITYSRSGKPNFYLVTKEGVYKVCDGQYASSDTGDVFYENQFYWDH
jgi:hypothetical protein